ncbi:hypothetical protein [Roseateles sp.]|uniref:hypothetical protein n=1 Tax=Roseateles sp. TaxID=1971397 RepID=UPI00286BCDE1|nr:hypothetical protein [Roseateles sp.]
MSMINDLKGKAAGYLDEVGKKKDEIIEKAASLKREHDENQQRKMESWVYKKEAELKELEKALKKREELIRKNELKLKQKFFVRFIGVAAGLSAIGFFALAAITSTTETEKHSLITPTGMTEAISPTPTPTPTPSPLPSPPQSSEPYTPRESTAYGAYGDIDATNPKFDVGKYCLEKEKKGGITFEECLGVAAAKIMSRK